MKKRNGWLYAFWILIIVILVLAIAVGLISWAGSSDNEETSSSSVTGVTLDKEQLNLETEGENATATITATVETEDGETFGGAFLWTSLNEDVATVVGDGDTATVTAVAEGSAIITVTAGGKSAVCLVVVSEFEAEPSPYVNAALSATAEFEMTYTVFTVTVTEADLALYEDGTALLNVTFTLGIPMTLPLDCTYTIADGVIALTVTGFGEGEGTVTYDDDGSLIAITFTSFFGEEQDPTIPFVADGYEGTLSASRWLVVPDPENDELDASAMSLSGTESFEGYDYTVAKSTTTNDDDEVETVYTICGTASAMTNGIVKWYNDGETGAAKVGDSYITLKIFVGIGNKISYTSYGGVKKSYTNTDGAGKFDGDYFFVCERLTGVNKDGSQVTTLEGVSYTISDALGTVSEDVNIEFDMRTAPWDGESISTAWDTTTEISQVEEYTIYSAEELAGLAHLVNDDSDWDPSQDHHGSSSWVDITRKWTIKLGADIDLNDKEWEPIGGELLYTEGATNYNSQFRGSFDGQNHTVYNLKVTRTDHAVEDGYDGTGLFGFVGGGEVKNLTVENATVSGRRLVGGIIGVTYEHNSADTDGFVNVDNCHLTGHIEISGHHQVGGIVGSATASEYTNCTVEGDSSSFIQSTYAVDQYDKDNSSVDNYDADASDYDGDAVGGIVGYLCRSEASISSPDASKALAEGVCNYLTDCAVSGVTISGCRKVGGLVGHDCGCVELKGCTVENCVISLVYNNAYSNNMDGATGTSRKLNIGALVGEFEWHVTVTGDCTVSNVILIYLTDYGISGNYTPEDSGENPYLGLFGGSRNQAGYEDSPSTSKPYTKVIYETGVTVTADNFRLVKESIATE